MLIMRCLIVSFLPLILTSCFTIGQNFPDDIQWIKNGHTTQKDILQRLGQPLRVGYDNSALTYTFAYYRYSVFKATRTKDLSITFDQEKRVKKYSFTTSFPKEKKSIYQKEKRKNISQ